MSNPTNNNPFQFLDAFERDDVDLYFGRDREVGELYELTHQSRLIIFFGASGTGKTSMVQCGLANRFPRSRWQELYIRRDGDINAAILRSINNALADRQLNEVADPIEGLQTLYDQTYTPIYLTLDQLEEIFILQPTKEEKEQFFIFLQAFLDTALPAKIILVMREEFIAHLWDWEYLVPSIFDFRYRISHLPEAAVKAIIAQTLGKLHEQQQLQAPTPAKTANSIYGKLEEQDANNQLTYVQVMLKQLYDDALKNDASPPLIDEALVETQEGDVFDRLLDNQLTALEQELGKGYEGVPLRILAEFVTDERTKKILPENQLESLRKKYQLSEDQLNSVIRAFENMRILKRYES